MHKNSIRFMVLVLALCYCLSIPALADVAKGARGDEVKAIQQRLIDLGYLTGKADGQFGGQTEKAVKAYQEDMGLPSTGIVDYNTQAYLDDPSMHAPFFAKAKLECSDLSNGLEVNESGYNSRKQLVKWCLNVIVPKESWMDDNTEIDAKLSWESNPINTMDDYSLLPAWNNSKSGKTSFVNYNGYWWDKQGREYEVFYYSIYLPDNSAIAGRQWIELEADGDKAIVYFNLNYKGDYYTSTGWRISDVAFENLSAPKGESVTFTGSTTGNTTTAKQYTDGRLPADQALKKIESYRGLGWSMDKTDPIGHNNKGEEVGYGIGINCEMAPSEFFVESVSWTNVVNSHSEGIYSLEEDWENAKRGKTTTYSSFFETTQSDGSLATQAGIDIYLPDDPYIAGEQSFTVKCENFRAVVRVQLTYRGNYQTGKGWDVKQLGVTVTPA